MVMRRPPRRRLLTLIIILHVHQIAVEAEHGVPGGLTPCRSKDEASRQRFAGLPTPQRDHGLSVQGLPEGRGSVGGAEEGRGELFHVGRTAGGGGQC